MAFYIKEKLDKPMIKKLQNQINKTYYLLQQADVAPNREIKRSFYKLYMQEKAKLNQIKQLMGEN